MIEGLSVTIVAVAENVRIGTYTAVWLSKNGLISEQFDGSKSIFTPAVVNCVDEDVELLILRDRFQLLVRTDDFDKGVDLLGAKLRLLLEAPHPDVRFTALGVNFEAGVYDADEADAFNERFRARFFAKSAFLDGFESQNSAFGFFASESLHGMKRQLDIKPVEFSNPPRNGFALKLNYHVDCDTESTSREFADDLGNYKKHAADRLQCFEEILSQGA